VRKIRAALEVNGIEFIEENETGEGIKLKTWSTRTERPDRLHRVEFIDESGVEPVGRLRRRQQKLAKGDPEFGRDRLICKTNP